MHPAPISQTALFRFHKIPSSKTPVAKLALAALVETGVIQQESGGLFALQKAVPTLIGTLHVHARGFGFVTPTPGSSEDIFIPKNYIGSAIDGDTVEIEVCPSSKKDKGPEGKVLQIVERGRSHLGGVVYLVRDKHTLIYSPLLGTEKPLTALSVKPFHLKVGDRVLAKVVDWGDKNKPTLCEISKVLGSIEDASIDVPAAIEEFRLSHAFPEEVEAEALLLGSKITASQCKGRLDLTKEEIFTIDPTTAKDFDDALHVEQDEKGCYHLGVHIADVAHYVIPGSALDSEAEKRANSTYFPGACIPMLPETLSNHLCSLKPKVRRLCISVLMTFSPEGDLLSHAIRRSVIKSVKRFTYEEAKQVLEGHKKSPHKASLEKMVELCLLLKQKRRERGSVDFGLPEMVLALDDKGQPYSYHVVEYDITHQLVEEYMLKANEVVAKELVDRGLTPIFRVHEEPAAENKEDFFSLARMLGFCLPPLPTAKDVQALFASAKDTPFAQTLAVSFIRSMKLAQYSCENIGHFGLSLEYYSHFTSPIRRYPDLIIQRLLFAEEMEGKDLQKVAEACSMKERISFKAEQSVKSLKKLRLLETWHREDPQRIYPCLITKIKSFGLYFELPLVGVEGFLHVSDLPSDYFVYESARNSLYGTKTHRRFCVGDAISTKLLRLDLIFQETSWQLVGERKKKRE